MPPPNRYTSTIWYHFDKKDDKGICHHCGSKIAMSRGSTGNLKRHLRLKHPFLVTDEHEAKKRSVSSSTEYVTGEVCYLDLSVSSPQFAGGDHEGSIAIPIETESTSSYGNETTVVLAASPESHVQPAMEGGLYKIIKPMPVDRSQALDKQLLRVICSEYKRFTFVEDEHFKKLVKMLCPTYSLPSPKSLSDTLLPNLYDILVDKVKDELCNAKAICLTSDCWTNIDNVSYYSLTAHYIDCTDTKLKSYMLQCSEFDDKFTPLSISKWIDIVLKKYNIHTKITAIVTENNGSLKSAASILKIPHITCFAHSLNLIVQYAVKNCLQDVIDNVKEVVQYIRKNSVASRQMEDIQDILKMEKVKLKDDASLRWISTLDMLERFIFNKKPIIQTFKLLGVKLNVTDDCWNEINHSVKILSVFNDVTKEMLAEQSISLSKATVLLRIMGNLVKDYLENNENLGERINKFGHELLNDLTKRFLGLEPDDLVAEAVLLDPRFKKQGFFSDSLYTSAYNGLITKMTAIITENNENRKVKIVQSQQSSFRDSSHSTNVSAIWDKFDEEINALQGVPKSSDAAITELDKYMGESYLLRNSDPLDWWESRKHVYPILYHIALKRLCVPATSVPSERIFTKVGQINTEKRYRFSSKKVSKMIFLNHNWDLL